MENESIMEGSISKEKLELFIIKILKSGKIESDPVVGELRFILSYDEINKKDEDFRYYIIAVLSLFGCNNFGSQVESTIEFALNRRPKSLNSNIEWVDHIGRYLRSHLPGRMKFVLSQTVIETMQDGTGMLLICREPINGLSSLKKIEDEVQKLINKNISL